MPRFVLLEHDWPAPHFDLLLECGGVLKSWRLHGDPRGGGPVPAEAVPDHRMHYLDYEGEVSGGRGTVRRVLAGEYEGELAETWVADWRGVGVMRMGRGPGGGLVFALPSGGRQPCESRPVGDVRV